MKKMFNKSIDWGKKNYLLIIGIIVASGYLYSELIVGGYKFSYMNIMYAFLPFKSLEIVTKGPFLSDVADNMLPVLYDYIHHFNFTFWAPNIGIGAPQSMSYYLSIFKYIYLLPFDYAVFFGSMMKYLIAFIGMYLLCKEYGLDKFSRFSAGIVYTFSSAMVAWNGWPHTEVAMWAPFLFLFIEKYLKSLKIIYLFPATIILTMMFFAGMPTYVAYFLYLLGIYVVVQGIKYYRKDLKKLSLFFIGFSAVVIISVLLSLPYTGELLNSVGSNGYMDSRRTQVFKTLEWRSLDTLMFPYIRNGMKIHFNESTLYTGIFTIFMLPLTLINIKKKKNSTFWLVVSSLLLILIFTNLLTPIYAKLPMINSSSKFRVIILFNFTSALLVGINLNDVVTHPRAYIKNKTAYFTLFILVAGYIAYRVYSLNQDLLLNIDSKVYIGKALIIFVTAFLLLTILIFSKKERIRKVCLTSFCLLMIWDMSGFAKNYMPMIAESASVLPEPTDSLSFVKKNTKNQEKIAPIGEWTFFPSSNLFYGIRDIRMHDFVATNTDVQSYYSAIGPDSFTSATRIAFREIDNENLLKYMGVKYTMEPEPTIKNKLYADLTWGNVGAMHDNIKVEQQFISESDGLAQIKILAATYQNNFDNEQLSVQIIDKSSEHTIRDIKVPLQDIQDNEFLTIDFDAITNSKGKTYILRLSADSKAPKAITFYRTEEDAYNGDLIIDNKPINGDIMFYTLYSSEDSFIGEDGLVVEKLDDYSKQFELVDKVDMVPSSADVLEKMKANYEKNTAFVTEEEVNEGNIDMDLLSTVNEINTDEKIQVDKIEKNGTVQITTTTSNPRLLIMNEYNDGNWKAYVDGKETEVIKANYLFRAIEVPQGEHTIQFKYQPTFIFKMFIIAGSGLVVFLVLFLFRNKIQKKVNCWLKLPSNQK